MTDTPYIAPRFMLTEEQKVLVNECRIAETTALKDGTQKNWEERDEAIMRAKHAGIPSSTLATVLDYSDGGIRNMARRAEVRTGTEPPPPKPGQRGGRPRGPRKPLRSDEEVARFVGTVYPEEPESDVPLLLPNT